MKTHGQLAVLHKKFFAKHLSPLQVWSIPYLLQMTLELPLKKTQNNLELSEYKNSLNKGHLSVKRL